MKIMMINGLLSTTIRSKNYSHVREEHNNKTIMY